MTIFGSLPALLRRVPDKIRRILSGSNGKSVATDTRAVATQTEVKKNTGGPKRLLDAAAWRYFVSYYREQYPSLFLFAIVAATQAILVLPVLMLIRRIFDVALPARHVAQIVLIGAARIHTDAVEGLANVRLLGRKPFAELPAYLAHTVVALIPFELNDLTRAINPIKLREYLAAGVPVVTTALPELLLFRGHEGVDVVPDGASFVAAVTRRLARPAHVCERRRISESMRGESWSGRLDQMLRQVEHLL